MNPATLAETEDHRLNKLAVGAQRTCRSSERLHQLQSEDTEGAAVAMDESMLLLVNWEWHLIATVGRMLWHLITTVGRMLCQLGHSAWDLSLELGRSALDLLFSLLRWPQPLSDRRY